jgi:hypothetical protein
LLNNAQSETRNTVSSFWSNLVVWSKNAKSAAFDFSVFFQKHPLFDQKGAFKKLFPTRKNSLFIEHSGV